MAGPAIAVRAVVDGPWTVPPLAAPGAVEHGQKPITAGQRGDFPQFRPVLEGIRVPRPAAFGHAPARTESVPIRPTADHPQPASKLRIILSGNDHCDAAVDAEVFEIDAILIDQHLTEQQSIASCR